MKKLLQVVLSVALVCYPLMIYLGLEKLPWKSVALGILVLFVLRILLLRGSGVQMLKRMGLPAAVCGLVLTSASLALGDETALLWYPVLVSTCGLFVFGWTLFFPPSMIESFARLAEPDLPDEAVPYTRKVTMIWCLFFIANGIVALMTVLSGDRALWALYNGLLSYICMGLLFGGEWVYRKWVLKV